MPTNPPEPTFGPVDRYALREKLGDGGGGTVYRARDRALDRDVALKRMRPLRRADMDRSMDALSRASRVEHPHLVHLLDVGQHEGEWYCAMELVEGTPLCDYVRTDTSASGYDELRLRESLSQVAEALEALHAEGLLHRDVKTSNVRISPEGRAVLLDLDLVLDLHAEGSRALADADDGPLGTPPYMSPEQAAMGKVGPASDWYGFGVVLFECLTGALPFDGADLDVLLRKQREAAPSVLEFAEGAPADLVQLCESLLARAPDVRPAGWPVLRALGVRDEPSQTRSSLASLLTAEPPLVGRERQLSLLNNELRTSRAGTRVAWLHGGLGAGKTALVDSFAAAAAGREDRPLVLRSRCPRDLDVPHQPAAQIVPRLVEALVEGDPRGRVPVSATALRCLERAFPGVVARLTPHTKGPGLDVPDPLEQRWRALDALRQALAEVARHRPVLWCVDDYHLVDVDTQRLLRAVIERPDAPAMLLLLAGELQPTDRAPAPALVLELSPLDSASAEELAHAQCDLAALPRDAIPVDYWEAGALPLWVLERVRHLAMFERAPHRSLGVEALLTQRIRSLEPGAHRIVRLLCCAIDPVARAALERAAGLPPTELGRLLASLRMSGLVRAYTSPDGDLYGPAHPLVRDVVEASLTPDWRTESHAALAQAFTELGAPGQSGRLVRFLGEGGQHTLAAEAAWSAAELAHERLAFQRAAELFVLGASLDPPAALAGKGHERLTRMADALSHAGWLRMAGSTYRQAADVAPRDVSLGLRQRAASHLLRAGATDEGREQTREVLQRLGLPLPGPAASSGPRTALRRLWLSLRGLHFQAVEEGEVGQWVLQRIDALWSTGLLLGHADRAERRYFMTRALLEALSVGEPKRVARALCSEAWMSASGAQRWLERPDALLGSARTIIERLDSAFLHGQLALVEGLLAFSDARVVEAAEFCRDAERVLRDHCRDVVSETLSAQLIQLAALTFMGRFHSMRAQLSLQFDEAEERGDTWACDELLGLSRFASALTGESARKPGAGSDRTFFSRVAEATSALGRLEDALPALHEHWDELQEGAQARGHLVYATLLELRARAYVARGRRTQNTHDLELALSDARTLEASRESYARGFAWLIRANVASLRKETDTAVDALEDALLILRPARLDLWVPAASHCLGALVCAERGRVLQVITREDLARRGVHDAERHVRILMPGF